MDKFGFENDTVQKTVKLDMCVSCGICKAVCPSECITMKFKHGQFLPNIQKDKCVNCKKCFDVCPGLGINYQALYKNLEQRDIPSDIYLGHVLSSYIAWSKDETIRKEGSSGGVITQLIINLIRQKEYKKAFVVKFENFNGNEIKSIATNEIERIRSASKSKYLPVSVEEVINYISNNKDDKIIVIGTSCHIHGIKKYLINNRLSTDKILFLGLFCEKTLNFNLLRYYENTFSSDNEVIENFDYRNKEENGWPGNTKIVFSSEREVFVDRKVRMKLKTYFQLTRCLFCFDKLNQFADISFGDCYIPGEDDSKGKSNIIIRTEKGRDVIENYVNMIELKEIDLEEIISSQNIEQKENNFNFAKLISNEHNLYPDLIEIKKSKRDLFLHGEKVDYEFLNKKVNSIKERFNYGKYYLEEPEKFEEIDPVKDSIV